MAAQWSGEFIVADYGDLQASTMAVDCLGYWAVLAGRRNLTLVNLDEPRDKVTKTPRQSKWDISCVQWNPHASHAHLFVTACNQRLDLYSWKDSSTKHHCSMKAHSRTVSDVDWSPFDVNVIASCSVDTFTYLWDVRDPKKPACSFQTVSGASQIKWNKITNNMFATSHEGDVRLWDPRKGNSPLLYIAAHLSKIHGLDWSPLSQQHLATSSQDCTVKFWDISNSRKADGTLNSGSPVWRARYTPFGHGLITVVVPQLRRGVNSLYLWNIGNQIQPVHQFVGHTDVVLEFQWRRRPPGSGDHQLVTWSKDQSLRIWKIEPNLQRLCGDNILDSSSEMDSAIIFEVGVNSKEMEKDVFPSPQSSMSGDAVDANIQQPRTLQQEFSLVNINIPNVTIEEMDPIKRACTVMVYSGTNKISLVMSFPANYPNNAAPTFEFQSPAPSKAIQKKLIKVLNETSQRHVKRNVNCLEPCLRQLAAALEGMNVEERKTPDSDPFSMKPFFPISGIGAFIDSSIPFPRTSGARFCSTGFLVCFGRSREAKRAPGSSEITPKALSELAAYASRARPPQTQVGFQGFGFSCSPPNSSTEPVTISAFYMYKEKKQRPRIKSRNTKDGSDIRMKDTEKSLRKPKVGPIQIYTINRLLTVNKQLGENYKISTIDIPAMCLHNGSLAATVGRRDLVQLWSLVAMMSSPNLVSSHNPDDGPPWGRHPFGRRMLKSLMDYYCSVYDVQTLAMLVCIFWDRLDGQRLLQNSTSRTSIDYVPANTDANITYIPGSSTDSGWSFLSTLKVKRSNSWSFEDSFEDYRIVDEKDPKEKAAEAEKKQHENHCKLLDPAYHAQYDQYLKAYADILYRWGLRNQCNHVLKHTTMAPEPHKGIEFAIRCCHCFKDVRGAQCGSCKMAAFKCAICHLGVRGASNFCLSCGHGGHTLHMMEWFQTENVCPTGCGCQCLLNSELCPEVT